MSYYHKGMYANVPTAEVGAGNSVSKHPKGHGCFHLLETYLVHDMASSVPGYDVTKDKTLEYENKRIKESLTLATMVMNFSSTFLSAFIQSFLLFYLCQRTDLDVFSRAFGIFMVYMLPHVLKVRIVDSLEDCVLTVCYTEVYTPTWTLKFKRFFQVSAEMVVFATGLLCAYIAGYQANVTILHSSTTLALPMINGDFTEVFCVTIMLGFVWSLSHWFIAYRMGEDRQASLRKAEADVRLSHLDAIVMGLIRAFIYILLVNRINVPFDLLYVLTCAIYNGGMNNNAANLVGAMFISLFGSAIGIWFYNIHIKAMVIGRRKHLDKLGPDPSYAPLAPSSV